MAKRKRRSQSGTANRGKYEESKHKRDQSGRYDDKPGAGDDASRAWSGRQVETATKLTKQEAGDIGERIAIKHLQQSGLADARPLNMNIKNYPIDLIGGDTLVEVKTGLVSNSASAQQWRATIGEPGKEEKALLKTLSAEAKKSHNDQKRQAILDRKNTAAKDQSRIMGRPLKTRTVTIILHPDRKMADIYEFEGFHLRIGWTSEAARRGFKRTVRYG